MFTGLCSPYMVLPNTGWRVLLRPEPALGLALLYLVSLVTVQTALSRHQGTRLEEPACAESQVFIRRRLLHFACGPRGRLDSQQESRLVCLPIGDKPPSWDPWSPKCLI